MPRPRWTRRIALAGSLAALAGLGTFFAGPPLLHAHYRARTTDAEIAARRQRYTFLSNAELSATGAVLAKLQSERWGLFLWFHARGLPIDEGHEAISTLERWRELAQYWRAEEARADTPGRGRAAPRRVYS